MEHVKISPQLITRNPSKFILLLNIKFCLNRGKSNTGIYNLISVSQITRLLLGDVTISSKTNLHNGSKKEKRSYGKVRNNKT